MAETSVCAKMDTDAAFSPNGFDKLLAKNVPHILEKIFLSLDIESFKNCMEVCQAWRSLLASYPRGKWMDKHNLNHVVWRNDHPDNDVVWETREKEVVYFDCHVLHYIQLDGETRTVRLSDQPTVKGHDPKIWILKHTILVRYVGTIYFIDKATLNFSKIELPHSLAEASGGAEAEWRTLSDHFDPNVGVRLAFLSLAKLAVNEEEHFTQVIWLGQISMEYRQETDWHCIFDQDYITDGDACCYFTRVPSFHIIGNQYSREPRTPIFTEDGSKVVLLEKEPRPHLRVFTLEQENSKFLWSKGINPGSLVCGNANSLFLIAPEGLKILNIQDGTERKSIEIWEQQLRASAARFDDGSSLIVNGQKYCSTLITNKYLVAFISPSLFMVNLDTLELQRHRISQEKYLPRVKLNKFNSNQLIALQSSTGMVNHYHLDPMGGELDKIFENGMMMTSKKPCWAFDNKLSFKEICKGVYVSIKRRKNAEGVPLAMAVEVISWKSEELPTAMAEFFSATGFRLKTSDSDSDMSELSLSDTESSDTDSSDSEVETENL